MMTKRHHQTAIQLPVQTCLRFFKASFSFRSSMEANSAFKSSSFCRRHSKSGSTFDASARALASFFCKLRNLQSRIRMFTHSKKGGRDWSSVPASTKTNNNTAETAPVYEFFENTTHVACKPRPFSNRAMFSFLKASICSSNDASGSVCVATDSTTSPTDLSVVLSPPPLVESSLESSASNCTTASLSRQNPVAKTCRYFFGGRATPNHNSNIHKLLVPSQQQPCLGVPTVCLQGPPFPASGAAAQL